MYIKQIYKFNVCFFDYTFFQDVHYGRFFTGSMNRQKDEDLSDGIIANKM